MNIYKLLAGIIVLGICLGARTANANDFRSLLAAEKQLLHRISQMEIDHGAYSTRLYTPLKELGELLDKNSRHEEAIEVFRRMQHLVHRHYGVHDQKQIESVDLMINSYAKLGDFNSIDKQQHFRYHVAKKAFDNPHPDLTTARIKIADWYRNTGRFTQALAWYEESLESASDMGPYAQIRVLRSEALTQFLSGKCCASEALLEALEIVSAHPESGMEMSRSLEDLIDMLTLERKRIETDMARYDGPPQYLGFASSRDVLKLMTLKSSPELGGELYVDFGEREPGAPAVATVGYPIAMCGTTLNRLTRSTVPDSLSIELTVTDTGKPQNIEITGDVPIKLKRYLRESLQRSLFRSATDENGSTVSGTLKFTQSFQTHNEGVSSRDEVSTWSHMLVAQTCQIQGLQRI